MLPPQRAGDKQAARLLAQFGIEPRYSFSPVKAWGPEGRPPLSKMSRSFLDMFSVPLLAAAPAQHTNVQLPMFRPLSRRRCHHLLQRAQVFGLQRLFRRGATDYWLAEWPRRRRRLHERGKVSLGSQA